MKLLYYSCLCNSHCIPIVSFMQKCTIIIINCLHNNAYLESIKTSIIDRKLGQIPKKHNKQIMEHNRLKPNQLWYSTDTKYNGIDRLNNFSSVVNPQISSDINFYGYSEGVFIICHEMLFPWYTVTYTTIVYRYCMASYDMDHVMLIQIQTENEVSRKRFKGIIPSLVKIWREEGFLGYYKVSWILQDIFVTFIHPQGNGTNVLRIVPYMAVQFAAYEEYKKVLILECCSLNRVILIDIKNI